MIFNKILKIKQKTRYNPLVIQRRIYSFILVLLFAFAQQQALLHSYAHLNHLQQANSSQASALTSTPTSAHQDNTDSDQHSNSHSELCSKCIAFAGMASAIGAQTQVLPTLLATFTPFVFVQHLFTSSTYTHYQSRAPPRLNQA